MTPLINKTLALFLPENRICMLKFRPVFENCKSWPSFLFFFYYNPTTWLKFTHYVNINANLFVLFLHTEWTPAVNQYPSSLSSAMVWLVRNVSSLQTWLIYETQYICQSKRARPRVGERVLRFTFYECLIISSVKHTIDKPGIITYDTCRAWAPLAQPFFTLYHCPTLDKCLCNGAEIPVVRWCSIKPFACSELALHHGAGHACKDPLNWAENSWNMLGKKGGEGGENERRREIGTKNESKKQIMKSFVLQVKSN